MTEAIETPAELADVDLEAIAASFAEGEAPVMTHTLLEIWNDLLSNAELGVEEHISPMLANSIISKWDRLEFSDIPAYWALYHELMIELRDILHDVIATDPDCYKHVEDDGVENRKLYMEVLFGWTDRINQWEEQWDCTDPRAAIELAAIADVARMFTGQTGIVEHLSQPQMNFTFGDDERTELAERLAAAQKERS